MWLEKRLSLQDALAVPQLLRLLLLGREWIHPEVLRSNPLMAGLPMCALMQQIKQKIFSRRSWPAQSIMFLRCCISLAAEISSFQLTAMNAPTCIMFPPV